MNFSKYGHKIKSFNEIRSYDFFNICKERVKQDIENQPKDYILRVDEDEFKKYLIDKHFLVPLTIDYKNEEIANPERIHENARNVFGDFYQAEALVFNISYPFSGSGSLFSVQPSTWTMTYNDIYVNEDNNKVSFRLKTYDKNPKEFLSIKENAIESAFTNLENVNSEAKSWNESLPNLVSQLFQSQKNEYLKENDFFAAINVKVNNDTASVFSVPTIKKKVIPQPKVSKKEFSSEPMMTTEMYTDILKVIYDFGKNMEKKPSIYSGKDEESIRNQFLLILETRYDSTTATGETFNKKGKTDIILKYANDGSNLFVAECKFWHGAKEFHEAISQLFDRYLTWRDSKVALLLFVRNNNFTNTLNIIKTEAVKHPYFIKELGERGESSFSYQFRLPQDKDKMVYLEIIAFHFNQ